MHEILLSCLGWCSRPVIKDNPTHVVAAHQKNILYFKTCDSKLHTMISWHVMSMKLNIGKKIAGLEIMTLNHEKM